MKVSVTALLAPTPQDDTREGSVPGPGPPRSRAQSGVQCKVSHAAALEAGARPLGANDECDADRGQPTADGAPTLQPGFDVELYAREADSSIRRWRPSEHPTMPTQRLAPMPDEASRSSAPGKPAASVALTAVPRLLLSVDDLSWFDLEPVAFEFLAAVDGSTPLEVLFERTKISVHDGISVVEKLVNDGVVILGK